MTSKEPKDLGVKIGSELEVFWKGVQDNAKKVLKEAEYDIILQQAVIQLCEQRIRKEQILMKK